MKRGENGTLDADTCAATRDPIARAAPDMVGRVALAICCPHGCRNADAVYAICQAATFRADARAAIEAMREPTPAMVLAADGAVEEWRKTLSRDEAFLRHYTPRPRKAHTFIASATPEEKHAIRYRAMIDAALAVAPAEASPRQVSPPIRDAVNPSLKEV